MAVEKQKIELYTDGACSGNPGPGGWCAILKYKEREKVLTGGDYNTTNNRMELLAVINGLNELNHSCDVTVYSDSKYICDAFTLHWFECWKNNEWRKFNGKSILNPDLWQKLDEAMADNDVRFVWVEGHSGHTENERCDKIAVETSKKFKNGFIPS